MMDILQYYKEHGQMSKVITTKDMLNNSPTTVEEITKYVQGFLIHLYWGERYGVTYTEEHRRQPLLRSIEEKFSYLREKGYKNLSEITKPEEKLVGICRDFCLIATALCREAGIPARERCGFAKYFIDGKYMDHWVFEYWNEETKKWIMVDPQLDQIHIDVLKISFDPLDVSENDFITAPKAWLLYREGKVNPMDFGIAQWWGLDYIIGNLILDANSLEKNPMQPWDLWEGYRMTDSAKLTEEDFKKLDELADLCNNVDDNFEALQSFMEQTEGIRVPGDLSKVKTPG